MWLFVSSLFHLACFQGSFVLQHVLALHYILWLNNNPLCRYTTFCLPVLQLVDIWVVSTFLAIMYNAHMNSHAFVQIYVFISVGCIPKNRIVGLYGDCYNKPFEELPSKMAVLLYTPTSNYESSNFFISSPTFFIVCLFFISIIVVMKWYLTVVLICIS